jgi:hypothetical protein
MKNPGLVIPDAMTAIRALNEAIKRTLILNQAAGPAGRGRQPGRDGCLSHPVRAFMF